MDKIEDYLTVEQVAKKMQFEEDTIRKWCRDGVLPYFKVGRQFRLLEKEVVEFIKQGRAY